MLARNNNVVETTASTFRPVANAEESNQQAAEQDCPSLGEIAENPAAATRDILVKGAYLPPLSLASDIPFLKYKIFRRITFFTESKVPPELEDLDSKDWRDNGKLLAKVFKLKGKPAPRQFPFCLLDQAKTLTDRMIVVNWWVNFTREEQANHWNVINTLFSRPRRSSSPLGKHADAAAAERKAARDLKHEESIRQWEKERQLQHEETLAKQAAEAQAAKEKEEFKNAQDKLRDEIMDILETTGPAGGKEWIEINESASIGNTRATRDWGLDANELEKFPCEVGKRSIRNNLQDVIECAEAKFTPHVLKTRLLSKTYSLRSCLEYGSYKKHKFDQTPRPAENVYISTAVDLKEKLKSDLEASEKVFKAAQQEFLHKQGMVRALDLLTSDIDPSHFEVKSTRKKRKRDNAFLEEEREAQA